MSDPAAIEASIHLLFDAESNAFLAEHDLVTDYDEEEDQGTRVLSDKAISLLAAWLAGEGVEKATPIALKRQRIEVVLRNFGVLVTVRDEWKDDLIFQLAKASR